MSENYDATWLDCDWPLDDEERFLTYRYFDSVVNVQPSKLGLRMDYDGKYTRITEKSDCSEWQTLMELSDILTKQQKPTTTPTKQDDTREKSTMGRYDNLTDQQKIDKAVKEAIAAPKLLAEVQNRVGATKALLPVLEQAEVGTVVRFQREYHLQMYVFAAIKTAPIDQYSKAYWYVTGSHATSSMTLTTEDFVEWMTTSAPLVMNVQVGDTFIDVTWEPDTEAILPAAKSEN